MLFLGAGDIGKAMISRLTETGMAGKIEISVCDPYFNNTDIQTTSEITAIYPTLEAAQLNGAYDVIVIAIAPELFGKLAHLMKLVTTRQSLVISVMPGINVETLRHNHAYSVVRAMPNIGAKSGHSATGCYAGPYVTEAGRAIATRLLQTIGSVYWVKEESHLHAVTAISGCGPAYFFAFTEALAKAGISLGLPDDLALDLAIDTLHSASASLHADRSPARLRDEVTTPRGVTAAALKLFGEENNLETLVRRATKAANDRSTDLE
ncbi:hypothetical protein TH19_13750 [Thalassospira profundimaris]|uniref:Pyrroline-5-carboxylate reductase n=1 Tax=Thalassospira profundimaris TaxID=502049 RepID=A0A367W4Z2_9PROT|nr:hypothetical protein TH19_13750 [Thalassospira profundimaris]